MNEIDKRKILVVEDSEDLLDLICMMIEGEVDQQLVTASSGNQAISKIEKDIQLDTIDLIISDFNMSDGNGIDLYKYIKNKNELLPFAFISGEVLEDNPDFKNIIETNPNVGRVEKPFKEDQLLRTINELLAKAHLDNAQKYYRFKLSRLMSYCPFSFDVFLDVSKDKRIQLFRNGDHITEDDLKKYHDKGVEYFYVPQPQAKEFLDLCAQRLARLISVDEKNIERSFEKQNQVLGMVHEMVVNMGISPNVALLTKQAIEHTLSLINTHASLKELVVHFTRGGDYLIGHGLLAAYIACHISDKIGWDIKNHYLKLSFVGVMHDMSFARESLARVKDLNDDAYKKLTNEEKLEVKNHPLESAKILESIDPSQIDAYNAIVEHHERPDGTGFPKGISSNSISAFGALFSISHEIADFLFTGCSREDILFELGKREASYKIGNFKKPYFEAIKFLESDN